jgi:HAD superfamily hydrolase (TIGR01549 family)
MIRGIVFDLDGTLWDSVDLLANAWVETLKVIGYQVTKDQIKPLIGLNGREITRRIAGDSAIPKFLQHMNLFDEYVITHFNEAPLFNNTLEVLKELRKRKIKLGIATSTPRHRLEKILDYYSLRELFDVSVGGDEVLTGKPDPSIYLKAFNQMNIDPKNGMIVGDTEYDIIPAKKIGAIAVLVLHDNKQINEKPDYIIRELNEIIKIVDELNKTNTLK